MADFRLNLVDLSDYHSDRSETKERFVQSVGDGLKNIGFFVVRGHDVSKGLLDEAYAMCKEFFSLPVSEKSRYDISSLHGQRGFTSFGREHAKDSKAPDLKEFWHVGRDLSAAERAAMTKEHRDDYPENIWPGEVAMFQSVMQELFRKLDACSLSLLEACSLYLGEEKNFLPDMVLRGNSILRIIHYPPLPQDRDPTSIRAAAHEDINFITLLPEATASGLELLERNGNWLPVKAEVGDIIVDAGDMLQNLTNGLFKSTTHRVVNPPDATTTRYSMPFFVHPRSEVDLTPMKSLVLDRVHYPSIHAGAFLKQRLAEIGLLAK